MSHITLYPPIDSIRQRLFGLPDELLLALAENHQDVPFDIKDAAMNDTAMLERVMSLRATLVQQENLQVDADDLPTPPAFIHELIAEKVSARLQFSALPPAPGLIVQLDNLLTPNNQVADLIFAAPFAMLLDSQDTDSGCWQGWLVSPDIQYASYWDFVLQEDDGPFDPACGMVQLWNPLLIYLPEPFKGTILGRLPPARLQALRAMAAEFIQGSSDQPRAKPGHIATRPTLQAYSVVTGTPLAPGNDPRLDYQYAYHHAAQLLNAPARAWQFRAEQAPSHGFSRLLKRLIKAWDEAAGDWVQAHAAVAFAMTDNFDGDHKVLDLTDDLRLELVFRQDESGIGGLGVIVTYLGLDSVKVRLLKQDETLEVTTLSADFPTLEAQLADITEQHWLRIERGTGAIITLPLYSGAE